MDLYADNILDHYRHPRHTDEITGNVTHMEENLSCGDKISVTLNIENEKIIAVGWKGEGCAISQAAMSIVSEELIGKSIEDVASMNPKSVYELLGVPVGPRRFKCALLCLHTLKNALHIYEEEEPESWTHTVALGED